MRQHSYIPAIWQSAGAFWSTVDAVIHTTPPVCRFLFGDCLSAPHFFIFVRSESDYIILELGVWYGSLLGREHSSQLSAQEKALLNTFMISPSDLKQTLKVLSGCINRPSIIS
jgi:hypothetical protein